MNLSALLIVFYISLDYRYNTIAFRLFAIGFVGRGEKERSQRTAFAVEECEEW